MKNNSITKYLLFFFLILIFTHFLPFNRSSLSPDDYALMLLPKMGLENFFIYADRPILFLWLEFQYSLLKDSIAYYFYLLIISNYILIILCYILLNKFYSKSKSFIITVLFIVLLSKVEIYQNSIMIHINIVTSLYILSLIFLINSFKNKNYFHYFISLLLYSISIFWYEIGFFLPFLIIFISKKNKLKISKLKYISPFILVMVFYSLIRLTGFFGIIENNVSHNISFNAFSGIFELFNHVIGRYFIKNLIYGLYQFLFMPIFLIFILILLNLFLFYVFQYKINFIIKNSNKSTNSLLFFICLFILSLIPMILNGQAGGRNLIIPSISISLFLYFFFYEYLNKKIFLNLIFILFLFASQGNAFSHYVASNIHYSIIDSIEKNKININNADYFLFDAKSLSVNIKHSLVNNNYNLINTYFGSQVWEIWGINSILRKLKINSNTTVLFTIENFKNKDQDFLVRYIKTQGNNMIETHEIILKNKKIFILGYDKIYNNGFLYGLNKNE